MNDLQQLPSVDQLLNSKLIRPLIRQSGRQLVVAVVRSVMENIRVTYHTGQLIPSSAQIIQLAREKIFSLFKPTLIPVINATGVILHTNLGRAPLSNAAIQAMIDTSKSYSNLEYDLMKGERGNRSVHIEDQLQRLTGAESALVVNNNAAAVLLVLTALASHKRVIISRTQLIEIGGGFRVPDVMEQSGARLISIGTTNRVHLADYERALLEPASLVLCAHHSNFRIIGFTSEPTLKEIAEITHAAGIPFVHDLGSGALIDTAHFGIAHEPTVQESLHAGADIVCFSGDKLLGGPQSGIIVGKKELIDKIEINPLARVLRPDKLCLAALSATLLHYLKEEAEQQIPVWRMISTPVNLLKKRAVAWKKDLEAGEILVGKSMIGGGSLPEESQKTYLLALAVQQPNDFSKKLLELPVPIIARVENDQALFDPRTVLPEQDKNFLQELKNTFARQ